MTESEALLSQDEADLRREETVSITLLRSAWLYCEALGAHMDCLRGVLGTHYERLNDPDHRVPSRLYDVFFGACAKACGDAAFGMKLGSAVSASHLGVLGFLLMNCRSIGEALETYERFQRALGETLCVRLSRHGDTAVLALEIVGGGRMNVQRIESMAAAIATVTADLAGRALPWEWVSFEHVGSGDFSDAQGTAMKRCFGVEPARGPNRLRFAAEVLSWPVIHGTGDSELAAALHQQLERRVRDLGELSLTARAESLVRSRLSQRRRPDLEEVAKSLGLSGRVLQQRLKAEGCGFRELVDAARSTSAIAFLRQGAPAAEVGYLLGFSEEAAFFRAFKKWTGMTPSEARLAN